MINGVVYRMLCDDSTLVLRQVGHPTTESAGLEFGFVIDILDGNDIKLSDHVSLGPRILAHSAYHVNLSLVLYQ